MTASDKRLACQLFIEDKVDAESALIANASHPIYMLQDSSNEL